MCSSSRLLSGPPPPGCPMASDTDNKSRRFRSGSKASGRRRRRQSDLVARGWSAARGGSSSSAPPPLAVARGARRAHAPQKQLTANPQSSLAAVRGYLPSQFKSQTDSININQHETTNTQICIHPKDASRRRRQEIHQAHPTATSDQQALRNATPNQSNQIVSAPTNFMPQSHTRRRWGRRPTKHKPQRATPTTANWICHLCDIINNPNTNNKSEQAQIQNHVCLRGQAANHGLRFWL